MKHRILTLTLILLLVLPLVLACNIGIVNDDTTASETSQEDTTATPAEIPSDSEPNAVLFASADFQGRNTVGGSSASGTTSDPSYNNGNAIASDILKRIIQNMQNDGYTKVDATIFCGDYDIDNGNKASDSKAGIDAVKAVYTEMDWDTTASGDATTHIFVQGNHEEQAPVGTNGLSGSNRDGSGALGAFDTEHYGLYLLHEDYHPFKSAGYTDQMIDDAAAELKEYLDAKLKAGYSKPIFIAAHVPLHHNLWMHSGLYAKPFFDVINEAAGKGLNIIYLFGHDHGGYDQYIGGTDIFLPAGSVIIVPDRGTKATKQLYTLNFTYMTAGLSAYLIDDHSENELSGTIFEVYDDKVVIKRYNDSTDRANNGLTNLGNVGEERAANTAAGLLHTYYPVEYHSPQTLTFPKETEITDKATNVSIRAYGIVSADVKAGETVSEGNLQKITYDIRHAMKDGTAYNGYGTLTIPLPESVFADAELDELSATAGGRQCALLSYENGMLRLWVPCFDRVEITYTPVIRYTCKRVTASELEDGKQYLIVAGEVQGISSKYNKHLLSPEPLVLSSPQRVGLAVKDIGIGAAVPETIEIGGEYLFTFDRSSDGGWTIGKDGQYLVAGSPSGGWATSNITYRVRQLKYGAEGSSFKIEDRGNTGMVQISAAAENGKLSSYLYVTSYGNSCLMDLQKDITYLTPGRIWISYYYIYEVQD